MKIVNLVEVEAIQYGWNMKLKALGKASTSKMMKIYYFWKLKI